MINRRYRNTVRNAWPIQNWRGNMAQQRQHAVIKMDITLKLSKNYHTKPTPETGKHIQYDLTQLRLEPKNLNTGTENINLKNMNMNKLKHGHKSVKRYKMDYNPATQ